MVCRRLILLCWCLVSVIVRSCQPIQVDLNAKLKNNRTLHRDLEQTLESAGLEVVDTRRLPVIRRTHTSANAEVEQREGHITDKIRADGLEEEEEIAEDEEEEQWLPVYNGGKGQKINEEHRDEKRVKRESEEKSPKLHGEQPNGQLQYTTLHTRNNDDEATDELAAEAEKGEVDASVDEDNEEKNDMSTKAPKVGETLEEGLEDGTEKEGEIAKQQGGDGDGKADAQSDDADIEGTTSEDDAIKKEKVDEADVEQEKKETSEEDTSNRDVTPTQVDTKNKDDKLEKDAMQNKNEDVKKDDAPEKTEMQEMHEKRQETKTPMKDEKQKEESNNRRVSGRVAQTEGYGNADKHLRNLDLSKGKDKEPSDDDDDDGSGDKEEEDDKNSFLLETRDSTDDTGDDDSPASDDESEEESEEHVDTASSVLEKEDDEAKKQLTAATPKDKDADKDKESPTNEDENDDGRTSSEESDKDAEEGSGELEERNIETSTGSSRVAHETVGEDVEEEDVTTKKQSKRSKWQYYGTYGPGNWSKEFIGCSNSDHRFQSPINIVLEQTHFDDTREKITFTTKHTAEKSNSLLLNDAKTAKVVFQHMTVRVNGLERVYKVAWVQFRWGDANNIGSEHVIEGKRYPLEMQVLCYDEENFPDVIEAELVEDKNNTSSTIVILATLFEISDKDNQPLSSVAENLKSIQSPGQNISIPSLDLQGLLPKKSEYFYRYSGSLTSPPCQGGAEWIVFHELQTISASQLAEFRQLHEEDFEDGNYITIDYNWRPLQPLDGRVVTRSFPNPKKKVNQKTPKPSAVKTSKSSSHRSPAIDISVYTLLFAWKLFLG